MESMDGIPLFYSSFEDTDLLGGLLSQFLVIPESCGQHTLLQLLEVGLLLIDVKDIPAFPQSACLSLLVVRALDYLP